MDIKFREIDLEDADFILEIENNKDIWKVSHTTEEFSKKDIELFIARNILEGLSSHQKRWIITFNDIKCGCVDLFDFDENNKRAGIGIVIHKDFQNKDIASKSLYKFIKYCKKDLELHQLYCTILKDNYNSIKLFTKIGFQKTGQRKDWILYKNKYFDEIFYQLILK
ncbi:MAG: GNAT family N-acetyltransferase [Bacteroidetes bacterium]|nr:MAG: GNAT family N-acetyltransferase [Bacteroidota bacterium]